MFDFRTRLAIRSAVFALICASPFEAGAAEVGSLTLQQAVERTLERNPDLTAFGHAIEAGQGALQQARARPGPEIDLLVENVLGSGQRSSFDSAETTLSLGYIIERGARDRRIEVATADSEQLATEQQIRRLDVSAEAARRFITLLERQQALIDAQAATRLVDEMVRAVEERVRVAKAPDAEAARAHAQLARARLDEEHAEHQLAAARLKLSALWGSTEPDFASAQGDLLAAPTLENYEDLRSRLSSNSDVARLLSEKRLREAEVRLAEIRSRPPWHLTAGVRRFEDEGDHAFVVGFTVPLASRGASQGALSAARARSAEVDAQTAAVRVRQQADFFAIYTELSHAYKEVATLRNDVLPRIEAALEQSRYAYERGRYGYLEWVAAQRELLDMRRALLQAAAELHQFRIEIERLTGTALPVQVQR